ncbi:MAG TPA: phytanoyl-CoA dioxygenase family protein [Caulobacteraceae bacterium]|nr:phytanoyl-CoA dioxygenase family protein [Caulobacteraceae bacterium]
MSHQTAAVADRPAVATAAEIDRFWQDGAICLRGVFSLDWIELLREATDAAIASPGPLSIDASAARDKRFYIELGLWSRMPSVRRFIYESPAAQVARTLLRTHKLNLFFDQLFVKEPGAVAPTPWHQDQPYWPIAGRQVLSLWIPMDPVTLSTGGLEYVRGSHEWNRRFHPVNFGRSSPQIDAVLSRLDGDDIPDLDAERDRHQFLSWDMAPGDVLVHQAMTIHGASGNGSLSSRRRAYSIRWSGDDATWDPRPGILETIPGPSTLPYPTLAGGPMDSEAFPVVPQT